MKKLIFSLMRSRKIMGFRGSLLLTGLIFFLLSGCSRYQYIAVTGDAHQNKAKNFVVENDTAKIVYSFQGFNFPVTVEVYNKLNKPLYVDWTKSALIIDGQTLSYWQNKAQLSGTTEGYSTKLWGGVSYFWGNINGTISKHEKVSFIPPGSYKKTTRFYLRSRFFSTKNSESVKKESFTSSTGESYGWRMKYTFNKENAPLKFKSYITLSTDKDLATEFHLISSFWVDNITQTGLSPNQMQNAISPKTYIHKSTTGGYVIGLLVILGLIAGAGALAK